MLFHLIGKLYENTSLLIATNLAFADWLQMFGDAKMTVPVRRMISLVPNSSPVKSTISARHTCFCVALRSLTRARKRRRSDRFIVMEIPSRMRQTRIRRFPWESLLGFKCQVLSTRAVRKL